MKKVRWIFVCAVLVAGWPTPMAAVQTGTERVHKVVPLAAGGTVRLHSFSGNVTVTGTDRSDVVIDAVRKAPKDRLERIKLDISTSGSTVIIEANSKQGSWFDWRGNNVVETDFEIQVPRQCALDIDVFSSPVTVTGVSGSHRLWSFSGNLALEGISGPLRAKTFSGEIRIGLAGANRPDLNVSTFSGEIDVRVPSEVRANLDFDSFSGDLTSDLPLTLNSKHGHRLLAQLNAGGQAAGSQTGASDLRLKTFSGDVRIRR
ncbi:MAG: DUF4097 family beta strand repeat protein [Planctomycetes bacterium]|nr:DUF4097 family beta strand repeat protein [Planctomycetota bacterium]